MSAAHTPGPWTVADYGVRDRGGFICARIPASRYLDQDERFEREVAERAANMLLIAAAPDLLEALQLAYVYLNGGPGYTPENRMAAYHAARAAIAKATGAA